MRRTLALTAAAAAVVVLGGCGGDEAATPTSAETSSVAAAEEYVDQFVEAFRATHPAGGAHYDVLPSDWAAFVSTVEDLTPPEGEEMDHERTVAAFEAYVEAREEADDVCEETPGPGGPCSTAVRASMEAWTDALDRTYEIPGLSYSALIS